MLPRVKSTSKFDWLRSKYNSQGSLQLLIETVNSKLFVYFFSAKKPDFRPVMRAAMSRFRLMTDCLSKADATEESNKGRWTFRNKLVSRPFSKPVDPLQYRLRVYEFMTLIVTENAFFVKSSLRVTSAGIDASSVAAKIACFMISKKPACRYSLIPPPVWINLSGSSRLQDASLACIALVRFNLKEAVVVFLEDILVLYLCWWRSSLFCPDNLLCRWPVLDVIHSDMVCVGEVETRRQVKQFLKSSVQTKCHRSLSESGDKEIDEVFTVFPR